MKPQPEEKIESKIFKDATDVWLHRQNAIEEAKQALNIEDRFRNYYQCESCDTEWIDYWSCGCDDDCPNCGLTMSPYDSVDLNEDDDD